MVYSTTQLEAFTLDGANLVELIGEVNAVLRRQDGSVVVIDLRRMAGHQPCPGDIRDVTRWERALRGLERSQGAAVALLGRQVEGVALEIALACDFRIAQPDSQFRWRDDDGVWPSMLVYRMVQLLGLAPARRMLLLDRSWDARAAGARGLVDIVAEDPMAAAEELGHALGDIPDLQVVRQLLHEATTTSCGDALGAHLAACDRQLRLRAAS